MRKLNITFILLNIILTVLISEKSLCQVTQEWAAIYNNLQGDESDGGQIIAADGAGNIYVAGRSLGIGTGSDYLLLKYNSNGVQQWVARYDGPANSDDKVTSIAVSVLGNIYITGRSAGGVTSTDYATVKFNSEGVLQWVTRYNGPGNASDFAYSIVVDSSENTYVTGSSTGTGTDYDYATIKYNSDGIQQWVARYNGPGNSDELAYSNVIDRSGNVYVTGRSVGSGTSHDYATIKYNSFGVQQWVARYNGPGSDDNDEAYSIVVDNSGNAYVTGLSFGNLTGTNNATIKYNSDGVQQWVSRYSGYAFEIALDKSENVYVMANSNDYDYTTIKYNSAGILQWVSSYNGPGNSYDYPNEIVVDDANNVYITGQSVGSGTSFDCATIKYNSDGIQKWVARYNGLGNESDGAKSIVLSSSENIIVTGFSNNSSGTDTYCITIKYSQSVGINQINSNIPDKFNLSQNYPNPFNPTTNIEFSLPEKSFVKLKVFDITGKEVAQLVNENLSAGTFRYEFNAENLPSGLYFYKLETEKFSETKKMIILK